MRKGELEEMRASILKDLQDIAAVAELDAIVTAIEPPGRDSVQPVESVNQNPNLSNLPPPDIKRWRIQHKALLVVAVRTGIINVTAACARYCITIEEFLSWKRLLGEHGIRGLRTTRLHEYRRPASRAPDSSGHSEEANAQGSGS